MGNFITLPGVNPTGTPVVDTIVPAQGAILLLDARDLIAPTGGSWNNRAAAQAQAASGLSSVQITPTIASTGISASTGKVERTSKGGLHLISTASPSNPEFGWTCRPTDQLAGWVNSSGHDFYVSIWGRITRPQASAQGSFFALNRYTSAGATALQAAIGSGQNFSALGSDRTPTRWDSGNASPGAAIRSAMSFHATPDVGASTPSGQWKLWGSGNLTNSGASPFPVAAAPPSIVLYQLYLEDLTVSGRTFAQVNSIDLALYNDAFSSGGLFYGDTYTNPTTIP